MITVQTTISAPLEKVWKYWNEPELVKIWNHASDDWHCPAARNDVRTGGTFSYTMAAKDGKSKFDFAGTYTNVIPQELIEFELGDKRRVKVEFSSTGDTTTVTESFDPEQTHSLEMQRSGWQSILDNFKKTVETS